MNNIKFFVVTHKQIDLPAKKDYVPIVVGKNNVTYPEMYKDNIGTNISNKNSNYCELTALYWIWKNLNDIEYIGLCHYRRFFMANIFNHTSAGFLSSDRAVDLLKSYDVILPYPKGWFDTSVSEWFLRTDGKRDALEKLRAVVSRIYPDYISDYDAVMNGYMASYYNMCVMSKKLLNQYCEWLFKILFELENQMDLSDYTSVEARIYGFLSERLLNVWVKHNNLKVKYLFVNETEKNFSFKATVKDILKYNAVTHKSLNWMTSFTWGNMKKQPKKKKNEL